MKFDLSDILFSINKHDLACYYAVSYVKTMPLSWGVRRRVSVALSTLACDLSLSACDVLRPVRLLRFKSWALKYFARFGLISTAHRVGDDHIIDYLMFYYSARLHKSFVDYWRTHRIADTILIINEATLLYKQHIAQGDLTGLCRVFYDASAKLGYCLSSILFNNHILPFSCSVYDLIPEFSEYHSGGSHSLYWWPLHDTTSRLRCLHALHTLYVSKLM